MAREERQHMDIEERLAFALERLGSVLRQHGQADADRHGLYPAQLRILDQAAACEGRTTPSELALAQGVSLPTISDSLAALANKGLITRERSEDDARRIVVRLTPRGRRLAQKRWEDDDPLVQAARSLHPDEQRVLLAVMQKMIAVLQQRKQISTTAMCVDCAFFHPNVHRDADKPHHCGFVDAPFGDGELQINCPDFDAASPTVRERNLRKFAERKRSAS